MIQKNTPTAKQSVTIIGSIFHGGGQEGDFGWMLNQPEYDDAFFIFNDNEEQFVTHQIDPTDSYGCQVGGGNAVIRPYQCQTPPRALGIPTGKLNGGGYQQFTPYVKWLIDQGIKQIKQLVSDNDYTRVFYSTDNEEGDLGGHIFNTLPEIKQYIVQQIRTIAD